MLKLGGGYDDVVEMKADPNVFVIGNHTGIMKGCDWNTAEYWERLNHELEFRQFRVSVIDAGSIHWLDETFRKFAMDLICRKTNFAIITSSREDTFDYFRNCAFFRDSFIHAVYIRNQSQFGANHFDSDAFYLVWSTQVNIPKGIPLESLSDIKPKTLYAFPERFDTTQKRNQFVIEYGYETLVDFYLKILSPIATLCRTPQQPTWSKC